MADLKALAETLVNLTVKDVQELAGILKDDYGIEPAAAAVAMVAGLLLLMPLLLPLSKLSLTLSCNQVAPTN